MGQFRSVNEESKYFVLSNVTPLNGTKKIEFNWIEKTSNYLSQKKVFFVKQKETSIRILVKGFIMLKEMPKKIFREILSNKSSVNV